jgi:16S rRNA (guanine966-N2)-methyltransferase
MSISITGGSASGIKLEAPKGISVRPTGVRSKRALFDSLGSSIGWHGKTVVDLFSGSGALGLEAISRGAAAAYLVEQSSAHCRIAEKNIEKVKKATAATSPEIVLCRWDALFVHNRLSALEKQIDIILADPPYAQSAQYLEKLTADANFAEWVGDAILIWETPDKFQFSFQDNDLWKIENRRKFAGTEFLFLRTNDT